MEAQPIAIGQQKDGAFALVALRFATWAQRWFPDPFIFAGLAVVLVAGAALAHGVPALAVAQAFGGGFWSLITFTLQQAIVVIGGYIVASSPPAARLIDRMAQVPRNGRTAVAYIAVLTLLISLVNWSISLIFSGLLARAMGRRTEIRMDYRAAAAAAYLGLGTTWAMGLSSSAAQLEANAASMPADLVKITGVIPFTSTIFLWQSMTLTIVLIVTSVLVAYWSAPSAEHAVTAEMLGVDVNIQVAPLPPRQHPGEWLEYSPLLTLCIALLGGTWIALEFVSKNPLLAISNLNTYNFILIIAGLVLHWRPRSFLNAAAKAVPATTGIIIQFPLYGAIAAMTTAYAPGGQSLASAIAGGFVHLSSAGSFPILMGAYSAVLGFFIPSGGGKWLLEAPYVMQAANDLKIHLGWAVQVYNAAEALPNLINPFWMLPLLGVMGVEARRVVGFTALQLIVHTPIVLLFLWLLGTTLTYTAPILP